MENAKYSAKICLAWFQIQWWIAEQTFLIPFSFILSDLGQRSKNDLDLWYMYMHVLI